MEKLENFLNKYHFLIILALSALAFRSLLTPGFYGASDDLHIAWLHQLHEALKTGQFPPRYVPDLSYGFGYPLFNFVFPLPFYIAEIFHLLGFSLVDSIKFLFGLTLPVSGYFMYKLLKEFARPMVALAGAIVYVYTPYRSTDVYVRGAIGEAIAFVFLPLIILSVFKLTRAEKNKIWIAIMGLSIGLLVMSHNIMSYMFFPFLLLLVFLLTLTRKTASLGPYFLKIFAGLFLGLLISIYFWLPAIVESPLMKQDAVFDFKDHHPTLRQLVTPYFGYGASVPGPYDGMSFFIGTMNLLLIFFGIFCLVLLLLKPKKIVQKLNLTKEQMILVVWAALVFFISVFMMNFRSIPLWESLPFLSFFQFPWRFLSMTTLVTPIFIVLMTKVRYSAYIALLIIVAVIFLNFSYFTPHDFLGRTDEYYLNRYIPIPEALEEYKKTGEEYLRLPQVATSRPGRNYPLVILSSGGIKNLVNHNKLSTTFEVDSNTLTKVNFNRYSFPGWQVQINGQIVNFRSGDPFGQIVFDVPAGKNKVSVKFKETNFRLLLDLISLLSTLTAITMIIGFKYGKN